ncbi:MAG: hypothetical protein HY842_20225, partial [Bacteroidetes bacterium]|nr:hypothetical protein [Bacteroidota bacterium]
MRQLAIFLFIATSLASACQKDGRKPDETYNPVIEPANVTTSTMFTNTYFPYQLGKINVY